MLPLFRMNVQLGSHITLRMSEKKKLSEEYLGNCITHISLHYKASKVSWKMLVSFLGTPLLDIS